MYRRLSCEDKLSSLSYSIVLPRIALTFWVSEHSFDLSTFSNASMWLEADCLFSSRVFCTRFVAFSSSFSISSNLPNSDTRVESLRLKPCAKHLAMCGLWGQYLGAHVLGAEGGLV